MQVTYDGSHSLLIGNLTQTTDDYGRTIETFNESAFVDTWEDYGLIPTSVPVIAPPDVQENTVEVPGSNGIVDLTDVLLGYPLYYNRSGSLDFYVDHTHSKYTTWENAYDRLLNDLHGFNKQVVLKDARGYYYDGRLKVNQWKSDKLCSQITLDYNFAPYKRMIFTTIEDWLWDPFDFVNGTIPDKKGWFIRTVNSDTPTQHIENTYTVLNRTQFGRMPVVPDVLIDADTYENYDLLASYERPYILYYEGKTPSEITSALEANNGYRSDIRNSERVGTTSKYLKHDPLITLGSPVAKYIGVRLVNPRAYNIKMSIDFRQGRL